MPLSVGLGICHVALSVVTLVWALFVLDPAVTSRNARMSLGYGALFVLASVASVATVGGRTPGSPPDSPEVHASSSCHSRTTRGPSAPNAAVPCV